jgi:type I restriction enzyme, S subunit
MKTSQQPDYRHYLRSECAVFNKTKERFGGLSNMAGGFPLVVNGVRIRTSEALYQACRFPHMPDLQRQIIDERSPMAAKMRGKPFRSQSRPDWDEVRVALMRWSIRVKLTQNPDRFGAVLEETGDLPIVEHSRRDRFWGAVALNDDELEGQNVLGRLLMELRQEIRQAGDPSAILTLAPPAVPDFTLYGEPIGTIDGAGQRSEDPLPLAADQENADDGDEDTNASYLTQTLF